MSKITIRRGYNCPRWMHQAGVSIPNQVAVQVDPSLFTNDTIYKMRLISLSFTSNLVDVASDAQRDLGHGTWHSRVLVELGKSGCSDQNLLRGSISGICSNFPKKRQKMPWYGPRAIGYLGMPCWDVQFQKPFRLPRGVGMEVKVANRGVVPQDTDFMSFMANGYTDSGQPKIIAGEVNSLMGDPGSDMVMDQADLHNRGVEDINITGFAIKAWNLYEHEGQEANSRVIDPSGTRLGWVINPTVGTAWMPTDVPIPSGNIAPMCIQAEGSDWNPKVYVFEPDTYLYPEQQYSIRLINLIPKPQNDAESLQVNVCLYGELEIA